MSASSPLQSSHSDVRPWSMRELKVLELGVGNRRVVYGANVRPRLEIVDEHTEINLREHAGDILIALRLSAWSGEETRFATAGYDDRIVIWDVHGKVKDVLHGHVARIGALWELPGKRLASWGEDWSIIVWDLQKRAATRKKAWHRIPTFCSRQRVLVDTAGGFFCLSEYWQARIVDFEGLELTRLKWQFAPITAIRRLADSGGRWLTQSKGEIKLWSNRGALQRKIPRSFSFDDGYLELPGVELLVLDDLYCIDVFDADGLLKAGRGRDQALARDVRKYLKTRKAADKALEARSSYEYFRYRTNPLSALEPLSDVAGPPAQPAQPVKQKILSSFFERPDLRSVRTWLREELEVAAAARNRVDAALHDDRVISARARFLIGFSIAVGCAALLQLFRHAGDAQFALGLFVMAAIGAGVWAQLKIYAMDSAERVLASIAREIDRFVAKVRERRRYILTDVPALRVRASSAERTIREQMRQTIRHLADTLVFRECGVTKEQLLNQDRNPIVFSDWSALRESGEIPARNLNSFWWGQDGNLVYAVHHIQFVLLTPWKLDVFAVDYDFIAGRMYNKRAVTIYYGEVTSVTKRRVTRMCTVAGGAANVDAMELVLTLRSGAAVTVTMMEENASALRDAVRKQVAPLLQDQLRNLESEDSVQPPPPDYARKALAMERRLVQAELDALTVEPVPSPDALRQLEGVIASIKRQVWARKEPSALQRATRAERPSELS